MTKDQVLRYFGSVAAIAQALSISYQAVHSWDGVVPLLRQMQLERITGGVLTAQSSANPLAADKKVHGKQVGSQPHSHAVDSYSEGKPDKIGLI